jgi:putative hydrolase of the HAD superfamily
MSQSARAVIFDLDDTLFDHYHSVQSGLAALQNTYPNLQSYPLADLTQTYVELVEALHVQVLQGLLTNDQARIQRMQTFFGKYGGTLTLEEIQQAATFYRETYQSARQPVAGALDLLQHLRTDTKIGIITNNASQEQHEKLKFCGLSSLIDVLVISEEVGVIKPNPEIFTIALERLGCAASEAVMLGDAWNTDIVGASRVGIRPVWLNRFGATCPDPSLAIVITSLEPVQTIAALLRGEQTSQ